jgi:hypothetical protein
MAPWLLRLLAAAAAGGSAHPTVLLLLLALVLLVSEPPDEADRKLLLLLLSIRRPAWQSSNCELNLSIDPIRCCSVAAKWLLLVLLLSLRGCGSGDTAAAGAGGAEAARAPVPILLGPCIAARLLMLTGRLLLLLVRPPAFAVHLELLRARALLPPPSPFACCMLGTDRDCCCWLGGASSGRSAGAGAATGCTCCLP